MSESIVSSQAERMAARDSIAPLIEEGQRIFDDCLGLASDSVLLPKWVKRGNGTRTHSLASLLARSQARSLKLVNKQVEKENRLAAKQARLADHKRRIDNGVEFDDDLSEVDDYNRDYAVRSFARLIGLTTD